MDIKTVAFKDVEGILCDTGKLRAIYLPRYGGKLVSLKDFQGREWLAQDKNTKYIPPRIGSSYVECEVSGADDMFPTIDPCCCNGKVYPCHGEVCRVEHKDKVYEDFLEMKYSSLELGYYYKKTIFGGNDDEIVVKYTIKNTGTEKYKTDSIILAVNHQRSLLKCQKQPFVCSPTTDNAAITFRTVI